LITVRRAFQILQQHTHIESVLELTRQKCEDSVDSMKKGKSPKYWKNLLTDMNGFFKYCVGEDILPYNPEAKVPIPKKHTFMRKAQETLLPDKEVEKMYENLSKKYSDILYVI